MAPQTTLPCPLCCQSNFPTIDSLKLSLIKVTSCPLPCPICNEVVLGLDKLTIHLFAHSVLPNEVNANAVNQIKKIEDLKLVRKPKYRRKDSRIVNVENDGGVEQIVTQQNEVKKTGNDQELTTTPIRQREIVNKEIQIEPEQILIYQNTNQNFRQPVLPNSPTHVQSFGYTDSPIKYELQVLTPIATPTTTVAPNKCDTCDLQFTDEHLLSMHQKLVHETNDRQDDTHKFRCHLCQKSFKMKGSLRIHLRVAHYGFNIKFSADGQSVSNSPHSHPYQGHPLSSPPHSSPSTSSGNTNGGNKSGEIITERSSDDAVANGTTTTDQLSQQQKIDGNVCDICGKSFTTKYFLKKHKRLHTGEMPYTCSICGKTFTFQQSYHKHLLYHSDEKPHVCTTCGRAFKELSTLHNHERIHSGEKPFSCETCGKCFRQRVSYLVHRRIHTGVMPYRCTACDKSFRYKVSQRTHKCTAQPPGTVVRQAGDLLQRLLHSAAIYASPTLNGDAQQEEHHEDLISKSLDDLINESYNKMGIVEDPHFELGGNGIDNNVPSPSEGMQNLCLMSPAPDPVNFERINGIQVDADDAFRQFFV